jgi:GxxExxY protein
MVGANDLFTEKIIELFSAVHNELGYGFLQSVYREAVQIALEQAGFSIESEPAVAASFRSRWVGIFRPDLLVEGRVILELKTSEMIAKAHKAQAMALFACVGD